MGISEDELNSYVTVMRTYRDKFVAHLDKEKIFTPPKLDIAKRSVIFLYDYLRNREDQEGCLIDGPRDISKFYEDALEEGQVVYKSWVSTTQHVGETEL